MKTAYITCGICDCDFYVETGDDILFCISCGEDLLGVEWKDYRDGDYDPEYDD